jgi:hypothetical protein
MVEQIGALPEPAAGGEHRRFIGSRLVPAWYREMMDRYRHLLHHEHGWEVELSCLRCGVTAFPVYEGWTPSSAIGFGRTPTIYARLHCPRCGGDLKRAAGQKLVELFSSVFVPSTARRVMRSFIFLMLLWAGALTWGAVAHWRYYRLLMLPLVFHRPLIVWFNWQIHSVRLHCDCGTPDYKFMGLLGRSYCYRCSSCGRLLRLRD